MATVYSDKSKVSMRSFQVIEDVAKKSSTKIYKLNGIFDDEDLRSTWNAIGLYISRQLRMGRAVTIPNWGIFTFTAPEVNLNGVTNPQIRDRQLRNPVFIISKDFAKGLNVKSGIFSDNTVRPYSVHGVNGKIAQTKVNFTEVGIYCNKTKDQAKIAAERVIRQLADDAKTKSSVDMELPNTGIFRIRNNVAAIQFNDFLIRDAKESTHNYKKLEDKKNHIQSNLTKDTVKQFESFKNMQDELKYHDDNILEIDENARNFLSTNLNINLDSLGTGSQKKIGTFRPLSSKYTKRNFWAAEKTVRPQSSFNNRMYIRQKETLEEFAFRQLKYWIRNKGLNPEDAFEEFTKDIAGQKSSKRLTTEDLYNCMNKAGLQVNAVQVQELQRMLDFNKDGYVDLKDWRIVLQEQSNSYFEQIKLIVSKYRIRSDDLLNSLDIQQGSKTLNLIEVKDAFRKLDSSLTDSKALSAAKYLMKECDIISISEFLEQLGVEVEELQDAENYINPSWYGEFQLRLYKKLKEHENPNLLRDLFEQKDLDNSGLLTIDNFKQCFVKANLFPQTEITRLANFVEKDKLNKIDYSRFLKEMIKSELNLKENLNQNGYFQNLSDFINKLLIFCKKNKVDKPAEFYQRIIESLNIQELNIQHFVSFLYQKAFPYSNQEELEKYVRFMDVDSDSIISLEDIETFFCRLDYVDNEKSVITQNSKQTSPKKFLKESRLYPIVPLAEDKIQIILRELKQKLYLKKMSFYDFFRVLDINNDGFVTIDEWQTNLDNIIKYSQHIKDGMFAYMDKNKIGMIDYKSFLKVLEMSTIEGQIQHEKEQKITKKEDDWIWTKLAINNIRKWFHEERISVEDAFRVIDSDFDGFINKKDLEKFLIEVLHYPLKEIDEQKINRLFKLIDEFKRGNIELTDMSRLLTENLEKNENFAVTGGVFLQGRDSFDWRINAKQQIGLVLSRKFNSLSESFDVISNYSDRIIYKLFENWVKSSRALIGFDLTDQQIQIVYSDLDPHKKGYLTDRDWSQAFSGFDWRTQMLKEVQDTVVIHFKSKQEAFEFFTQDKHVKTIEKEQFSQAIKTLFQSRFTHNDINTLWNKLSREKDFIDFDQFTIIYDSKNNNRNGYSNEVHVQADRPQTANVNGSKKKVDIWNLANHKTPSQEFMDKECEQVVRKVKQILRSSNKSIEAVFKEFDSDGSGEISNLEFKDAFRKLGIGLTSKELDHLLNFCDESGDGIVNWLEFISKFQIGDSMQRIIERSKKRLSKINDYIHYYMLSPKDAFRLFNGDRTGKMDWNDFHKCMTQIYHMANEPLPSFAILKDIFQTIDIRRDGVIDMVEWTQTFRQFRPPDCSMQGRPMITQQDKPKRTMSASLNFSKKRNSTQVIQHNPFAYFIESSKEYDNIMKVIGRNRKFMIGTFNELSKRQIITFQVAKQVLQNVLMSTGIQLEEDHYPLLIKFAERDGVVDYKFMLEVYKERMCRISLQPDASLMIKNQ